VFVAHTQKTQSKQQHCNNCVGQRDENNTPIFLLTII